MTWDAQGGSAVPAQALRFGGRVGFLPETSRAGSSFQGWYTAPSGGEKIDAEARASGNVIFYARWKAKSYKVKFDANGGQLDGSASKKVKMGASYKAPKAARGGYAFVGWFTKKSGGTKVSSKLAIAKNHTLYAHWTTIDKTVRFSANGGKAVKSSKNVKFGKKYGKLPKTTRKGYTFDGWYTSKDGGSKVTKSSKVKSEKSSFKLYAHWTPKTYTVTWDAAGGSVGVAYPDGTVAAAPSVALPETYDAVYAMPADPVLAGCTFAGWWTKASGGKQILPGATVKITKNTTIYAHWNVV
ncbi:MAG: InlB B-repeat-containing protein [Clostridiales Family XIII bacterium]|nr:InlB B-repeat-containing protein [Clostridiales Family XIII bacterium]